MVVVRFVFLCGEFRCAGRTLHAVSKRKHRESTIWQRRFWEHQIRHDDDFIRHVDYIHFNPVKHGDAQRVVDWPYSTFYRFVRDEIHPHDWSGGANMEAVEYD